MRTKGSFSYTEEAEKAVMSVVTVQPQTTNTIKKEVKERYFDDIHFATVKRILEKLQKDGRIRYTKIGAVKLWNR